MALRHVPVIDGDLGCLQLLPLGQTACVQILNLTCVCDDCFLLEVSDEAMARVGAQDVREDWEQGCQSTPPWADG